jgi:type II secretory pathway pseudopilin PulG
MIPNTFATRPTRARRALSLVEVMISLAITSMLLTAIAAAFHSSSQIITENDEFFRATQAARVCLNQILTEVRRSDGIPATTINFPNFSVPPLTADQLPVSRPLAGQSSMEFIRYYRYDAPTKRIMLYFQDASGKLSAEYPIAGNVQKPPFSWEQDLDKDNKPYIKRLSVSLEVLVGNNNIRLSGSAAPRRSITYQ